MTKLVKTSFLAEVCACGCGQQLIQKYKQYIPKYIKGHDKRILLEKRNCACGCGFDKEVKVNSKWKYKHGHNRQGKKFGSYIEQFGIEKALILKNNLRNKRLGKLPWNKGKKSPEMTKRNIYNNPMKQLSVRKKASYTRKFRKIGVIPRIIKKCKCGCSKEFTCKINSNKLYISGHNSRNRSLTTRAKMSASTIKNIRLGKVNPVCKQYKTGWFFSKKNNINIKYFSSFELLSFQILESMVNVKCYKTQFIVVPYIFENIHHNYIVDLFVEYTNGEKQIIEIKPLYKMKEPVNRAKFDSARLFAEKNNMRFNIWTEKELSTYKNNIIGGIK